MPQLKDLRDQEKDTINESKKLHKKVEIQEFELARINEKIEHDQVDLDKASDDLKNADKNLSHINEINNDVENQITNVSYSDSS